VNESTLPGNYQRIVDGVRGLAQAFVGGKMTQEEFVQRLLQWESLFVRPANLTLTVCKTDDDWTSVLIKHGPSGKLHAAFEFLPEEARFRPWRHWGRTVVTG
jgi:hypothetical protein